MIIIDQDVPCTCQECHLPYKIDLIVPDHLWEKISPKNVDGYKGGGLLCGSCIMKKLEKILDYDYFNLIKIDQQKTVDLVKFIGNNILRSW